MSAVSKISFKVHKSVHVMVGIGYVNILQQKGYGWAGNCLCNSGNVVGDGVYALHSPGQTYTHSRKEDNAKQIQLKFQDGDSVSVELDPTTGKLTYSKEGCAPVVQETSVRSNTADPVHFCVLMAPDDVSIIA